MARQPIRLAAKMRKMCFGVPVKNARALIGATQGIHPSQSASSAKSAVNPKLFCSVPNNPFCALLLASVVSVANCCFWGQSAATFSPRRREPAHGLDPRETQTNAGLAFREEPKSDHITNLNCQANASAEFDMQNDLTENHDRPIPKGRDNKTCAILRTESMAARLRASGCWAPASSSKAQFIGLPL
jgi:hypothetical protein